MKGYDDQQDQLAPSLSRVSSLSTLSTSSHASPIPSSFETATNPPSQRACPVHTQPCDAPNPFSFYSQLPVRLVRSGFQHISRRITLNYEKILFQMWNYVNVSRSDGISVQTADIITKYPFKPHYNEDESSKHSDATQPSFLALILRSAARLITIICDSIAPAVRIAPRSWRMRAKYILYVMQQQPLYQFYEYLLTYSPSVLASSIFINYGLPILLDSLPWFLSPRLLSRQVRQQRSKLQHATTTQLAAPTRTVLLPYVGYTVWSLILAEGIQLLRNREYFSTQSSLKHLLLHQILHKSRIPHNNNQNEQFDSLQHLLTTSDFALANIVVNTTIPNILSGIANIYYNSRDLWAQHAMHLNMSLITRPISTALLNEMTSLLRAWINPPLPPLGGCLPGAITSSNTVLAIASAGATDIKLLNLHHHQQRILSQYISFELQHAYGQRVLAQSVLSRLQTNGIFDDLGEWLIVSLFSGTSEQYTIISREINHITTTIRRTYDDMLFCIGVLIKSSPSVMSYRQFVHHHRRQHLGISPPESFPDGSIELSLGDDDYLPTHNTSYDHVEPLPVDFEYIGTWDETMAIAQQSSSSPSLHVPHLLEPSLSTPSSEKPEGSKPESKAASRLHNNLTDGDSDLPPPDDIQPQSLVVQSPACLVSDRYEDIPISGAADSTTAVPLPANLVAFQIESIAINQVQYTYPDSDSEQFIDSTPHSIAYDALITLFVRIWRSTKQYMIGKTVSSWHRSGAVHLTDRTRPAIAHCIDESPFGDIDGDDGNQPTSSSDILNASDHHLLHDLAEPSYPAITETPLSPPRRGPSLRIRAQSDHPNHQPYNLQRGEFYVCIGRNTAGKSTLGHILARILGDTTQIPITQSRRRDDHQIGHRGGGESSGDIIDITLHGQVILPTALHNYILPSSTQFDPQKAPILALPFHSLPLSHHRKLVLCLRQKPFLFPATVIDNITCNNHSYIPTNVHPTTTTSTSASVGSMLAVKSTHPMDVLDTTQSSPSNTSHRLLSMSGLNTAFLMKTPLPPSLWPGRLIPCPCYCPCGSLLCSSASTRLHAFHVPSPLASPPLPAGTPQNTHTSHAVLRLPQVGCQNIQLRWVYWAMYMAGLYDPHYDEEYSYAMHDGLTHNTAQPSPPPPSAAARRARPWEQQSNHGILARGSKILTKGLHWALPWLGESAGQPTEDNSTSSVECTCSDQTVSSGKMEGDIPSIYTIIEPSPATSNGGDDHTDNDGGNDPGDNDSGRFDIKPDPVPTPPPHGCMDNVSLPCEAIFHQITHPIHGDPLLHEPRCSQTNKLLTPPIDLLNLVLTAQGGNVSGGFAQSLSLARMFLRVKSQVIVLDEALSMMDPTKVAVVLPRIIAFAKAIKATVFLTTHHLHGVVEHAHRVMVMEKGRIVEFASHSELISQSAIYQSIYGLHPTAAFHNQLDRIPPPEADQQ